VPPTKGGKKEAQVGGDWEVKPLDLVH